MMNILPVLLISFLLLHSIKCQNSSTTACATTGLVDNGGPCVCDVTPSICDVNCCCDQLCTSADICAFAYCLDNIISPVFNNCIPQEILFWNNVGLYNNYDLASTNGSLYCVYNTNFTSRNYYYGPPSLVTNATNFITLIATYKYYPSPPPFFNQISLVNVTRYRYRDPLLVLYPTNISSTFPVSIGWLGMPKSIIPNQCEDYFNPAGYLYPETTNCSRLLSDCSQLAPIKDYFGFKVASTPAAFNQNLPNNTNPYTVASNFVPVGSICQDSNGNTLDCASVSQSTQPCTAATAVAYTVTYNASGISSVNVTITISNVTANFFQIFSIAFQQAGSSTAAATTVSLSGNPGYIIGRPLSARAFNLTTNSSYIWTMPGGGNCLNSNQRPVRFGVNYRSSCNLNLSSVFDCTTLQNTLLAALAPNPIYIATLANASTANVADWLLLSMTADSPPVSGVQACSGFVVGQEIEVIYTRVGAVANPQNRIIGVRSIFQYGTIRFECGGNYCQSSDLQQTVEIPVQLSYIDATQSPLPSLNQQSIFLSRLPFDYFLPFYVENGAERLDCLWRNRLSVFLTGFVLVWFRAVLI